MLNITVELLESTGNYAKALVVVEDCGTWAGTFGISNTQLAIWRSDGLSTEQRIQEIGKLRAEIDLLRGDIILGVTNGDLGVLTSYQVNGLAFTGYVALLRNQLDVAKHGTSLPPELIKKIWEWTKNDTKLLSVSYPQIGIHFPSSGYAIYLASLTDIWGSIMNGQFGRLRGGTRDNVVAVLEKLELTYGSESYVFIRESVDQKIDLAGRFRNNLIHNYGLRVISTGSKWDWLNIDTDSKQPVINPQDNGRWHIDCIRLADHLLFVISDWIKENHPGLID